MKLAAITLVCVIAAIPAIVSGYERDPLIVTSELTNPRHIFRLLTRRNDTCRQLGLTSQQWQRFAQGRNSIFQRAFDPGTQDAVELLPGFARLQIISEIEDSPLHRMVQDQKIHLTPGSETLLHLIEEGEITWHLLTHWTVNPLSIAKVLSMALAQSNAGDIGTNYLYQAYYDLRIRGKEPPEAWAIITNPFSGPLVAAYRATRGSFLQAIKKIGGPTYPQQVDGAVADYLELRYRYGSYPLEWLAEDIVRRELRREKALLCQELGAAARNRLSMETPPRPNDRPPPRPTDSCFRYVDLVITKEPADAGRVISITAPNAPIKKTFQHILDGNKTSLHHQYLKKRGGADEENVEARFIIDGLKDVMCFPDEYTFTARGTGSIRAGKRSLRYLFSVKASSFTVSPFPNAVTLWPRITPVTKAVNFTLKPPISVPMGRQIWVQFRLADPTTAINVRLFYTKIQ